ncbi:MAG: PEGA domain-containing protein [Planctomycetes bacterium]|nr:PEGA domain-containing protein [Planctomycetota bacterium]
MPVTPRSPRRLLPTAALLTPLLLGTACTFFTSTDHVLVTSAPQGAAIAIDGCDTGRTTPARLLIGGLAGTDHQITLQKPGYRPATRKVTQWTEGYTSQWIDGAYEMAMPPLPFLWTFGDVMTPFGVRGAILPAELYVQLERDDAPLLGFDLLAARAAAAADPAK